MATAGFCRQMQRLRSLQRCPSIWHDTALRILPSRRSSAFTIRHNETWASDALQLQSVRIHQEATDWQKALEFGMGAVVWDCALSFCDLAHALDKKSGGFWRGKVVLELGAGCGAPGLTLAALGADVILTDRVQVLPLLERNVELNAPISAVARPLLWETAAVTDFNGSTLSPQNRDERGPIDIVLGTDLLEIDPDRAAGQGFFEALSHAASVALFAAPQCLVLLVLEERGLLTLSALGELFLPLLRDGASLFEAFPPFALLPCPHQRYLCLHSLEGGGGGTFAEWRHALEESGGRFEQISEEAFAERGEA